MTAAQSISRWYLSSLLLTLILGGSMSVVAESPTKPSAKPSTKPSSQSHANQPELRGVQLYTLRHLMDESVEQTLAEVAAQGYRQVEFAGFFGHSPAELKKLLEEHDLEAPASHFPVQQMEEDFGSVIQQAKALGSRYIVLAWLEKERRNPDSYRKLVENLNRWGRQARDAGLRLAYHNHDFEFELAGDFVPYQLLLEQTDPELVFFEMDMYWMVKAGQDPEEYFKLHPGRFPLWHLKDASKNGAMADVGMGVINFPALIAQSRLAGLEHAFVERDDATDPVASMRASFQSIESWGR